MTARTSIVLALPYAATLGQGGHEWAMLNWILGFQRCGHDVDVVEPRQSATADLGVDAVTTSGDALRRHGFTGTFTAVGPSANWTIGDHDGPGVRGLAGRADLLVNISGGWRDDLGRSIRRRLYLDLDPGFTQIWHAEGVDVGLDGHDVHATVGLDVGTAAAQAPTGGYEWIPTLPPVVVDAWENDAGPGPAFAAVGNWRSYGTVQHRGVRHGQKAHTFRRFVELPSRSPVPIDVALRIHADETDDVALLDRHRWSRVDPDVVSGTPEAYRSFVHRSRGEVGLAKEGYVVSRTGWVSDRSACFLAAGRPVVAQDTGGHRLLPDCDGFVRFTDLDGAVDRLGSVDRDWSDHARGARELARRRFAHDVVIPGLLEAAA